MPFAIMLMPVDVDAAPPPYHAAVLAAVKEAGGQVGPGGRVRLADGGKFAVETDTFWAMRISPGLCQVVFNSALRLNTYIDTAGSQTGPLKVKGSKLKIPRSMGPAIVVGTPGALCLELRHRMVRWNSDMKQLRAEGLIGPDDQPLEPPPGPGAEPRMLSDPSGIAAECDAQERRTAARLGWKVVRTVVTHNAHWGVVWRADIAPDADPSTWWRDSCWRAPGAAAHGRIRFSMRPLRMFDASKSVGPLPAG